MVKKKTDIGIIDAIKEAVSLVIEEKGLVTREDLKYLPNKDEFYSKMDELMGELKTVREEHAMLSSRTYSNTDSIEKLQKIHPHNSHPAFA